MMTDDEIAHIEEHQADFDELMDEPTNVRNYALDHAHIEDLYLSLCSDLDLEPRAQQTETVEHAPIDAACIALNGGNPKLARERWEPVVRTVLEAADKADAWLDQVVADRATAPYKDLIVNLWLYVGRHTWTQLTTEQKELFADVVDEMQQREYPDDYTPTERWWRE